MISKVMRISIRKWVSKPSTQEMITKPEETRESGDVHEHQTNEVTAIK